MDIPDKMQAVVLYDFEDYRLEERPVPEPGAEDVLVRVESAGICGTDVKVITQGMPNMPPFGDFIIGHEYSGVVVATGETVDEFQVGDRVCAEIHKGCGRCDNCLRGNYTACLNYGNQKKGHRANGLASQGGFAQYAVNHINTLYKLPDNISYDESIVITACGTSMYAIDMIGGLVAGESCLVIGPGPIGLTTVQILKALGADQVILTGTREERLALGKELGADHIIDVKKENLHERVMELTGGLGCYNVFDAAGGPTTLEDSMELAMKGGKICIVAFYKDKITADISHAVKNGVNIFTVRGEGRMAVGRALSLMRQGRITGKPLITHRFPLREIHKAFKYFRERIDGAMKVVLHPQEG
jgi:L-iditol 2-dehydrogenase